MRLPPLICLVSSAGPAALGVTLVAALCGCAPLGSLMSPYSETFSCKNDDHGQCIHPEQAYADALAGVSSKSDPAVSRAGPGHRSGATAARNGAPYETYRDSVYRELKGLIDAPVTPMLRPARTVRTLILPYADRQRPDRLYMARYVYSILDRPEWVVGPGLGSAPNAANTTPILGQTKAGPVPDDAAAPSVQVPLR